MKSTFPTFRLVAALGLAGGMMIGCQDLLNPGKTGTDASATTADQSGVLSLSIRNDSSCQGEWHAILDARSAGHPDSASEASFLATCVTEVKPEKDKPMPVIPPPLLPDSGTRCKWIVSQIDGGRDSLSVAYRKYCPDDCRKLEATDSASHEKLCRDPKPHRNDSLPPKHGDDSLPPKPHGDDTLMHPPKPGDDSVKRAHDTCDMLKERLEAVKPGDSGRAVLETTFKAHCGEPIPHDTTMPPPPPKPHDDSLPPPPKPTSHDSVCLVLKTQLATTTADTAGRSDLEAAFKAHCQENTLPPPPINCDELRLKMSSMDSTSVDYAHLAATLKEHCPEVPVK